MHSTAAPQASSSLLVEDELAGRAGRGDREHRAAEPAYDFLDRWTRRLSIVGFCGLGVIAVLTTYDGVARTAGWPRLSGFADFISVVLAIVVATCFPAGLLHRTNITIRFLGRGLGARGGAFVEALGASATLGFFAILIWQVVRFALDLQASNRTSGTIEMPIAPWWWTATAILALCLPVQAWVTWRSWAAALTGRPMPAPEEAPDL